MSAHFSLYCQELTVNLSLAIVQEYEFKLYNYLCTLYSLIYIELKSTI